MIYSDLLYSAMNNALRGVPAERSAALDVIGIADTLFPIVSQAVCEAAAANEYRRSLVMREQAITLAAGTATLSTSVLAHYIYDAVLLDPANLTKHYAYRPYPDFIRRGNRQLGIFTVRGEHELQVIDPNVAFTVPLVTAGARTLTIPCVVEKPGSASDDVDAPAELLTDLDEALAEALRGQIVKQAGIAA